jgi:hypothetical protein
MDERSNWMPCSFEFARRVGMVEGNPFAAMIQNPGEGPLAYNVPLPTVRRGNKLHLSGLALGIYKAEPGSNVTKIQIRGITHNNHDELWVDATPYSGSRKVEQNFPAIDCSAYDVIKVVVYVDHKGQTPMQIAYVNVKYQYV